MGGAASVGFFVVVDGGEFAGEGAHAHGEEEAEPEFVRFGEGGDWGCGGGCDHVRKVMWPRGNARGDRGEVVGNKCVMR